MKRRKDGRYRKTVKDETTGKTIYFYGMTEREVNRKMLDYERKKARGRTLKETAEEWYNEMYDTWAIHTRKVYRAPYRDVLEEFGSASVRDISPREVQAFVNRLRAKDLAHVTISHRLILLNAILDRAVVNGDIEYNPCTSVRLPKAKKTTRHAATTEDELTILNTEDEWLFPKFALLTGLRRGEILAMQWSDIDLERDLINVSKGVVFDGSYSIITPPKTDHAVRTVALLAPLKVELEAIIARDQPRDIDYIFSDDGGKTPLSLVAYMRHYREYTQRTGISCTAHQLRHSYATIAIEEGVGAKDLQNALGHANVNTTLNIYAEAREKSARTVGAKMNTAFAEKSRKKAQKGSDT